MKYIFYFDTDGIILNVCSKRCQHIEKEIVTTKVYEKRVSDLAFVMSE